MGLGCESCSESASPPAGVLDVAEGTAGASGCSAAPEGWEREQKSSQRLASAARAERSENPRKAGGLGGKHRRGASPGAGSCCHVLRRREARWAAQGSTRRRARDERGALSLPRARCSPRLRAASSYPSATGGSVAPPCRHTSDQRDLLVQPPSLRSCSGLSRCRKPEPPLGAALRVGDTKLDSAWLVSGTKSRSLFPAVAAVGQVAVKAPCWDEEVEPKPEGAYGRAGRSPEPQRGGEIGCSVALAPAA